MNTNKGLLYENKTKKLDYVFTAEGVIWWQKIGDAASVQLSLAVSNRVEAPRAVAFHSTLLSPFKYTPHPPRTHPAHTPHTPRDHPAHTPHPPRTHPAHTPRPPRTHPAPTPHTPRTHPAHTAPIRPPLAAAGVDTIINPKLQKRIMKFTSK
ncbi:unnamed protein product, partial [Brenthis ino]